MLRVWGRRNSFNVQKILWLIGELGLDYEHIPAGGEFGKLNEPEFRRVNPHGRIPVLEHDGQAIWESHAILRYLAAQFGGEQFWPESPGRRAIVDGWMDWAQTSLQPSFLNGVFWTYFRTPAEQRDWPKIHSALNKCDALFKLLDEKLKQNVFLIGEKLSLADIPVGTHLFRYFELDIDRPNLPYVEKYYARLRERSAYREHVMVSFEDLRGRPSF